MDKIDFKDAKTDKSRTDTVKINGEYRENSAGTGDYTKQEQTYYPIREDSDDKSKTDKYRENTRIFIMQMVERQMRLIFLSLKK